MIEKSENSGLWPKLYDPFRTFGHQLSEWLRPAAEASSGDEAYDINMELPGVSEQDIELSVENGVVTVSGEKRSHEEKKGDTWYFSERQYGAFRRSFSLPDDAQGDKAKAKMTDGVLHITVPRKPAQASRDAKKIPISRN